MAQLTSELVTPIAEEKVLELAYKISKYIDLTRASEEIYQAGVLVKLLRSLNGSNSFLSNLNSLLEYADKQQIIQGIIGIGKLKI